MKTLKKILLGIGLATSLTFGAGNKLKAQDSIKTKYEKFDRDHNGFPEEVIGIREEFGKGFYPPALVKFPLYYNTIIYYLDTDDDEFHDFIRIFNRKRTLNRNYYTNIVIRDFYIDKNTGLISCERKAYSSTSRKWDKKFPDKNFYEIVKKDYDAGFKPSSREYRANLTKQDLDEIQPGFGMRIGNLINAWKNEESLKKACYQER